MDIGLKQVCTVITSTQRKIYDIKTQQTHMTIIYEFLTTGVRGKDPLEVSF